MGEFKYIASYQYGVFITSKFKKIKKLVQESITSKMVEFGMDSANVLYFKHNKKVVGFPLEVKKSYGKMIANFNLPEEILDRLPKFIEINLINSIGMNLFEENLLPTRLDNNYISLFLLPIIVKKDKTEVYLYPIIKIYDTGVAIVELTIYSSDSMKSEKEVVNYLNRFQFDELSSCLYKKELLEGYGIKIEDYEEYLIDDIPCYYAEHSSYNITNIKDLAMLLVKQYSDTEYSFIGHHNFNIEGDRFSMNAVKSLMASIDYSSACDLKQDGYKNFREFKNSYKHYMSEGKTITIGNSEETRISSLVIDQMFIYTVTLLEKLKFNIKNENSISIILNIYNQIVLKRDYLNSGLKAYKFSYDIFNHIFKDYGVNNQISCLKEIIDVKLLSLQIKSNNKVNRGQYLIAILLTLLSSETIMKYILRPLYINWTKKNLLNLSSIENAALLCIPAFCALAVSVILKIIRSIRE